MADELLMGQKASDSLPVAPGRTTVLVIPCYNEELRLVEETLVSGGRLTKHSALRQVKNIG